MTITQLRAMVWAATFSARVKEHKDGLYGDSESSVHIATNSAIEANEAVRLFDLIPPFAMYVPRI